MHTSSLRVLPLSQLGVENSNSMSLRNKELFEGFGFIDLPSY